MSSSAKNLSGVTNHDDIKVVERFAAQPGYFVLSATADDRGCPDGVHAEPVLAWALEADLLVPYPVTAEGIETGNLPIQRPDGSVSRPFIDWFPSAEEWLADQREDWEAARSAKAS